MKAPKSFTGQDMVEINCHGGIAVINSIMELILGLGARQAEKGEFSKRAFLNGKIDLVKAESIAALVGAKTKESAQIAAGHLTGRLSSKIGSVVNGVMALLAEIEAHTDFPEEMGDIDTKKTIKAVRRQYAELDSMISGADIGRIILEGIDCVIIGTPNVGKSSLLNALLKFDRSIVTEIPGTTTDTIEEYINLNGIAVKLIDTAGIRRGGEAIEAHGIKRTKEEISKAELIIAVIDGARKLLKNDLDAIAEARKSARYLIVAANKIDKGLVANLGKLKKCRIIKVSALTGQGIDKLEKAIVSMVLSGSILPKESLLINARQKETAVLARNAMARANDSIDKGLPLDLAAIDLRDAVASLKQMTGEDVSEEIINTVFGKFCVGK